METYITTCQEQEQQLLVNRDKNFKLKNKLFNPKSLANRILLESGFSEGKLAKIKYKNGKLTIKV